MNRHRSLIVTALLPPRLRGRRVPMFGAGEAAAAACRGAEIMDQAAPGWAPRIGPRRLSIWSPARCVLGQLYGSYDAGVPAVGPLIGARMTAHGFDWPRCDPAGHRELVTAWRDEIARRRGASRGQYQDAA